MSIFKKMSKMGGEMSAEEKLYLLLNSDRFRTKLYDTYAIGEGMAVVYQTIWGWWKPRYVLNHNTQTAFEFMDGTERLVTVFHDDIDWESLKELSEKAIYTARCLSFHFPSFIRGYKNGVARVDWQLNPDGMYYMDDEGFGRTDDEEIEIYGFIDKTGKVQSKFRVVKDDKELEAMCKEAEEKVRRKKI